MGVGERIGQLNHVCITIFRPSGLNLPFGHQKGGLKKFEIGVGEIVNFLCKANKASLASLIIASSTLREAYDVD